MQNTTEEMIRRQGFVVEIAIGKLETAFEAVLRLLRETAQELKRIDGKQEGTPGQAAVELATQRQRAYLRKLGIKPDACLKKEEASRMIDLALGKVEPKQPARQDPRDEETLNIEVIKI